MFERRLQILLLLLAIVSFVLIARAFSVQVLGKSYWAEQSEKAMRDEAQLPTTRGRLLDYRWRELAIDQPCIDACIDYRAIMFEPISSTPTSDTMQALRLKWLRGEGRARIKKRMDNYYDLPLAERKKLLEAEIDVVRRDIDAMWHDLARLSGKPVEEIDEVRREIIRRVETQARIAWYNKFDKAQKAKADDKDPAWYAWMLGSGASEADIDKYELTVAEQGQSHPVLRDIDNQLRIAIETSRARYPGLSLRGSVRRHYPYGAGACHVIGRVSKVSPQDLVDDPKQADKLSKYGPTDLIGSEGMEHMLEQRLRGTRGLQAYAASGEKIEDTSAVPGEDVRTTIDIELQMQIEDAFKHVLLAMDKPDTLPMNGAAIAIDVQSGEVRALASWPTYDLNRFDELFARLADDQVNRPLHNRATMTALEPGSTVKPIVGLGAITDGLFGPNDRIVCDGFLHIGGKTYTNFGRCWTQKLFGGTHMQHPWADPMDRPDLAFPDALERSCNVFFETLGDRLGIEGLAKWFDRFGLGRPTGIGLPEVKGLTPRDFDGPPSRRRAVAWFGAIGQDQIAATPIQMANVAATIARRGVWKRPTLVPGESNENIDLHINPQALDEARQGMIAVVNSPGGTGPVPRLSAVLVAGKTGSAQSAPLRIPRRDSTGKPLRDENGRVIYDTVRLGTTANPNLDLPWYRAIGKAEDTVPSHAWMIGFAPANNPKIAYAAMVEYGGGGGVAAGSVCKQLLEACIEHGYLPTR